MEKREILKKEKTRQEKELDKLNIQDLGLSPDELAKLDQMIAADKQEKQ